MYASRSNVSTTQPQQCAHFYLVTPKKSCDVKEENEGEEKAIGKTDQSRPCARTRMSTAYDGRHIFVIGGRDRQRASLRDTWMFDMSRILSCSNTQYDFSHSRIWPLASIVRQRHATIRRTMQFMDGRKFWNTAQFSNSLQHTLLIFGGAFAQLHSPLWSLHTGRLLDISNAYTRAQHSQSIDPAKSPLTRRQSAMCAINNHVVMIYGGFVDFRGSTDELWSFNSSWLNLNCVTTFYFIT
jgi:hypothetical protein